MKRLLPFAALALIAIVGCGSSSDAPAGDATKTPPTAAKEGAEAPKKPLSNIILTDEKDGKTNKETLGKDGDMYIYFDTEVPAGTKVKGVFYLDKCEDAKMVGKIKESTIDAVPNAVGDFHISKPASGWPAGEYRIELFAGDKLEETIKFKVA